MIVKNSVSAEINVHNFSLWYGSNQALYDISLDIPERKVTAFIGPSGCGKSTLLRSINRLNDLIDKVHVKGDISIGGTSVNASDLDVTSLRKRVGMVFQKSNPFPMTIFENIAYPLKIAGISSKMEIADRVEISLKNAALWDEVSDRLKKSALDLSGGQQQRLCIARAIVGDPEVLLMDEPCSALDPLATAKIEELIHDMKGKYTMVIVTHSMSQASRVSDKTAFFYVGKLIESSDTATIFQNPEHQQTQDYISGRFG